MLHVLASLGAGGAETWLMHMLRTIDPARFRFDFLLNEGAARFYDDEAAALGATIHRGPSPRRPPAYRRRLREVLAEGGYDVVHSHLYLYSGWVLRVADAARVPIRIAQSHNAVAAGTGPLRRAYEVAMRRLIWRHATRGTAVTPVAADSLFGARWRSDGRFGVMSLGFDFSRFRYGGTAAEARASFGVPPARPVVGHVGSFSPQKNHGFLLDVLSRLLTRGVDAHLLLLTSPVAEPLRQEVAARGLDGRATVADTGSDVAALLAALDLFVMPSRWEGAPVAVLEAQAAGTRVLASEAIPAAQAVVPGLVERLPLEAGVEAWAARAAQLLDAPEIDRVAANEWMQASEFGHQRGWARLAELYGASPPQG